MSEILSKDDYITLAARLSRDSKTERLLEFIPYMLYSDYFSSRHDFSTPSDMKRRARLFMLELISKTQGVRLPSLLSRNPDGYILPMLLHFLNNSKKVRNVLNTHFTLLPTRQ